MNKIIAEDFSGALLKWARTQFDKELRSDFQRARTFDSFRSQRDLAVLLDRSKSELEILARVLPLQVLANTPDANKRLRTLRANEIESVEKLQRDRHKDYLKHFDEGLGYLRRFDSLQGRAEFKTACKKGREIIKETARSINCEATGAANGEWGLIFYTAQWRIAVSLNLARWLELSYSISISGKASHHNVCLHHIFLAVLGFGAGSWDIPNSEQFPDKLLKSIEFALWHKSEYERIIQGL